jgi:hypothetical protein
MNRLAIAPRDMLARKPKHGSPCNSCGLCCATSRCQIGVQLFGVGGACPALTPTGEGKYVCGVISSLEDSEKRDAAMLLIRAGEGCDARFNGEWTNKAFHKQQDQADIRNADAIVKAKKAWGIPCR